MNLRPQTRRLKIARSLKAFFVTDRHSEPVRHGFGDFQATLYLRGLDGVRRTPINVTWNNRGDITHWMLTGYHQKEPGADAFIRDLEEYGLEGKNIRMFIPTWVPPQKRRKASGDFDPEPAWDQVVELMGAEPPGHIYLASVLQFHGSRKVQSHAGTSLLVVCTVKVSFEGLVHLGVSEPGSNSRKIVDVQTRLKAPCEFVVRGTCRIWPDGGLSWGGLKPQMISFWGKTNKDLVSLGVNLSLHSFRLTPDIDSFSASYFMALMNNYLRDKSPRTLFPMMNPRDLSE